MSGDFLTQAQPGAQTLSPCIRGKRVEGCGTHLRMSMGLKSEISRLHEVLSKVSARA